MTKRSHPAATDLTHAAAPRRTLARRAPAPLVLEQRIMFDAAGVEAAVRHAAQHAAADAAPADTGARSEAPAAVAPPAVVPPAEANRTEVVFVEDNVGNVAQLVAGVRPGVEVIMLDHTRDGLQQMLDALEGHAPVDAIHLVSHGATGQLSLGTQSLSVDNLDRASAALAQLGTSLNAGGDLLLYGCDVAQGTLGAGFVERMAALTGADVAASTDITGSAAFAGNWTLEAHSGAIEAKALELDRAGWEGELVNTVFDANRQALVFNGAGATHFVGTGTSTNDVTRYNGVITIGGQAIDAVVTTTLDRATMIDFDSVTDPSTNAAYFQPTMRVSAAGGSVAFKIDFYLGGTYKGAGTGTAVTLQNVVVNSYDIDSFNSSASDRQFQVFQGFDSYELSTSTQLATRVQADGSVQFVYDTSTPTNNGPIAADAYRVKVYYDSMSSFVVKSGVNAAASGTFNGQAYFALDFSVGPAWSGTTVKTDTPAPNLSYSATTFAESGANDGAITATSTITLANGSFTGSDNAVLSGVGFSRLPAGLTALVTRTSATTATLSFTGNALAHANANDINNFGVSFGDAAFVSNKAAAVTGATRADLVLDFADPPPDTVAPVVTERSDSYAENRAAGTVVTTVGASDAIGVTGFRFAQSGTAVSADGYFAIGANGAITLTASGAAAGSSANDYELTPHTFVMGVQARDAAGNWSNAQNVTLAVTNVDDIAPGFTSAATGQAAENQAVLYTAAASDNADFTDHAVAYSLAAGADASRLTIDAATGVVRLAAGTLDFETKSSYTFTVQARDASGNVRNQAVTVAVTDVDEIAPTVTITSDRAVLAAGATANLAFTFSEDVGASFTALDVVLESGSIGAFVKVDATHYTAVYTPGAAIEDAAVSIGIAPGTVQDNAGNANGTGASLSLAVDTAAPLITGQAAVAINENTTAVHRFTASEAVTWSIAGGEDAARFTLAADGTLAFASAPDFEQPRDGATAGRNTYIVNLRAVDGFGNATVQAVTVTVADVNEMPAGAGMAFEVAEDVRHTGTLPAAVDPDGDTLTYALASGGAHGQASVNADGTFSYQGAPDYHGADTFRYTVSDGKGGSATYSVAVTVTPVNDAPVAAGPATGSGTVGEAMAPVIVAPFSDRDSAALTYSATRADGTPLPAWITFDSATRSFAGTPPAGASGTLVLLVTGSDGALAATTSVTLMIKDAAVPTQAVAIATMGKDTGISARDFITADGSANRTVSGTLDAPLESNQVLRVSFDGGATYATASVNGASWTAVDTGAHRAGWTITAHVANSVTGSRGAEASQRVVLDIAAPPAPTVAPVASASTTPVVTGTATLAPGDTLTVTIDGKAYDVTPQNGTWSVTPAAPLTPGRSYDVATSVRDSAGNTTVNATAGAIVISAPVPPQVLQPRDAVVAPVAAALPAPVTVNDTAAPAVAPAVAPPLVPAIVPLAPGGIEVVMPGSVASNDMLMAGTAGRSAATLTNVFGVAALRQAAELSDVYTRTEGFRTVVARSDEPALVLFQGVPDQFIDSGNRMALVVPADAFAHTQPKAIVQLTATLQDGRPLPSWVTFTGQTGQFQGEPPAGLAGELRIKLTARDMDGREATALFRINVGQAKAMPGKSGLSEQLRQPGAVRGVVRAGGR